MTIPPNHSHAHGAVPKLSTSTGVRLGVDSAKREVRVFADRKEQLYPYMKGWKQGKVFHAVELKTRRVHQVSKNTHAVSWHIVGK